MFGLKEERKKLKKTKTIEMIDNKSLTKDNNRRRTNTGVKLDKYKQANKVSQILEYDSIQGIQSDSKNAKGPG